LKSGKTNVPDISECDVLKNINPKKIFHPLLASIVSGTDHKLVKYVQFRKEEIGNSTRRRLRLRWLRDISFDPNQERSFLALGRELPGASTPPIFAWDPDRLASLCGPPAGREDFAVAWLPSDDAAKTP